MPVELDIVWFAKLEPFCRARYSIVVAIVWSDISDFMDSFINSIGLSLCRSYDNFITVPSYEERYSIINGVIDVTATVIHIRFNSTVPVYSEGTTKDIDYADVVILTIWYAGSVSSLAIPITDGTVSCTNPSNGSDVIWVGNDKIGATIAMIYQITAKGDASNADIFKDIVNDVVIISQLTVWSIATV